MRLSLTASRVFGWVAGSLAVGLLPELAAAQVVLKQAAPIRDKAVVVPAVPRTPAKASLPSATPRQLVTAPAALGKAAVSVPVVAAPLSSYELRWAAPRRTTLTGGKARLIPTFVGATHDATTGLPTYGFRLTGQALASVSLRAPRYEPVSPAEAALLKGIVLAPEPLIRLQIGTETRQSVTLVSVLPLRRNPGTGVVERLLGFDISSTPAPAQRSVSSSRQYATHSALSEGRWIKIGVAETGMYRIDRNQLQSLGLDPASLDARNLQLWGNGGQMLPQRNSAPRPDDLIENPVLVEETGGSFGALTFYAQGPHTWKYQPTTGRYVHEQNLYSDTAYYFLTVGTRPGRRVLADAPAATPTGAAINSFDEHVFYERELISLLKQGRDWYGESFDSFTATRDFDFTLDGIEPSAPVQLTARVAGAVADPNTATFTASINSVRLGALQCGGYDAGWAYHVVSTPATNTWPAPAGSIGPDGRVRVSLAFSTTGGSATGNLDYLEFNYRRSLRRYGAQTTFRSAQAVGAGTVRQYEIAGCDAATQVWDVTDPRQPRQQAVALAGSTGSFAAAADSLREFIVFNPAEARPEVRGFGVVPNQDLHALNVGAAPADQLDLVIVTHPRFLSQANRLAEHRRQHDGLQVAVATTTQVWNEFSSGRQDITAIRDLMRLVYDRTTDPLAYPINLLLFGDASYDYKSNQWYEQRAGAPRTPTPDNTNFVPVYEARESLDPITGFSSEDYFTLMDDTEGNWSETDGTIVEMMDTGVGRLPAHDDASAAAIVDKLLRYDAPTSFGRWRNVLSYVADDADGGAYSAEADKYVTTIVEVKAPAFNVKKLYLDLFPQISVPSGQRSPANARAVEQAVEQGTLLMNYIGHGGETGWAAEHILDVPTINNWRNADRLTFMMTATCDFGRYDDPARSSGGEYALYNPQGGAVGLFTTTRPVYATDNSALNEEFHDQVFIPAADGRPQRIGETLRRTKATPSGAVRNSRNFALLGDPSMRLAFPELRATVKQVSADTLRALSVVQVTGIIEDGAGAPLSTFNGRIQLTFYDKPTTVMTLADESPLPPYQPIVPKPFQVRESVLYDGLATVTAGRWTVSFVVPRDIGYSYGPGKISLYAWSADRDAAGANTAIIVGGSSLNTVDDRIAPEIKLFMDDLSFQNGGTTGTDATLIAPLSDASGINTAGTGIGHEITVLLDGNRQNVLVMNPYYTSDVDSYQSGTVRYLFKGLTPGPHTLTLKAWDTFNNSAERTLEFVVANKEGLTLSHVLNYPNPFANHTTFHFDHNRQGDDLDVQVQLFTVTGRLVRTLQTRAASATSHLAELVWDGRDEYGDVLGRGVYVYKVNVRSTRDGSHASKYEKLVILN